MENLETVIRPGTTRGLDFVTLEELRKRTGVNPDEVLKWALAEMLCNSLDTDATQIRISVEVDEGFYTLAISDNGSKKLSVEEIRLILDFENKASSKRGLLRVSRGYLGNALKCVFGYSYALAESKGINPPGILVTSGNNEYRISLKPDRVKEVINSSIDNSVRHDDGFNMFTVKFPTDVTSTPEVSSEYASTLKDLVFATSIVNPTRKIHYSYVNSIHGWIDEEIFGWTEKTKSIRQETSVLWYTRKQFVFLSEDFVRARPETQFKEFVSIFRGFTAKKVIREILQKLNGNVNHDCQNISGVQFFPVTPMRDLPKRDIERLHDIMKGLAKPISKRSIPKVLGFVSEEQFDKIRERNGWPRLRYTVMKERNAIGLQMEYHIDFPFLIELAVFDRKPKDHDGLKVYQCVNFMASSQHVFSGCFNISYRLGRVGINQDSPVTVIAHLVCPVLEWLNYGKSTLGMDSAIRFLMEKAFDKILPIPKQPRVYRMPPPHRPLSWIPHGSIGNVDYEERLKSFANEIIHINNQRTSKIKYSSRGWSYLLEGLGKIHKGEFTASQKAINDCRKLGFLPIDFVAQDQDQTRHFKGIHIASEPEAQLSQLQQDITDMLKHLPSKTTDYWISEEYYIMMCVEKGDLINLFKPVCDQYHIPIVSSKGWAPILLRSHIAKLSQKAEAQGLKPVLLLFYDHDKAGLKITKTFRKNLRDCERGTGWSPEGLIIERFGLNAEDIEKYGLMWIENVRTGSGRTLSDYDPYVVEYGRRKCESNALFKNDETLKAGEEICRRAIEKYYGEDALERFRRKEEASKEKLKDVYNDSVWKSVKESLDKLIEQLTSTEKDEEPREIEVEKETAVFVDNKYYGLCPRCQTQFNYNAEDYGKQVRCRGCHLLMRLQFKEREVE